MSYSDYKKGFTLVELLLAMTFISILLVMIATLTMQVSKIYNKGITLRAADQAGQLISSEIQRKLNQADSKAVFWLELKDGGTVTGGRLCIGTDVYAWNVSTDKNTDTIQNNRYVGYIGPASPDKFNKYPDGSMDIRFIRFSGNIEEYCKTLPGNTYKPLPLKSSVTELLGGGDADLALRKFTFSPSSSVLGDPSQTIYHVSFILGTRAYDLIDAGNSCVPPAGGGDEYCAVNTFDFTARAGGTDD